MSKILQALKKAQADYVRQNQPGMPARLASFYGLSNMLLLIIFVAVALSSLWINVRTSVALGKANNAVDKIAGLFSSQDSDLSELKVMLKDMKQGRDLHVQNLKNQLNQVKVSLKNNEKELSEMVIDYNILKASLNDVAVTNQDLMDKYIDISEEIREIKNIKEQQAKLNVLMGSSVK